MENIKCPKCGSDKVKNLGEPKRDFMSAITNMIGKMSQAGTTKGNFKKECAYECQKCGHSWVE